MRQIIIDLGSLKIFGLEIPFRVHGYGLMLVLGFFSAIVLARWRARRVGENPEVITQCGLLSLIGGLVGARAAYVMQHWDGQFAGARDQLSSVLSITSGGLIYYGGLILAGLVVLAYLVLNRLPVRRFLDVVAVSLMVGLAFGRAGCLLNGCCFGQPSPPGAVGAMRFPMYTKPLIQLYSGVGGFSLATSWPTPVYESQFEQGLVRPDERLVLFVPSAAGLARPAAVHPPRYLHGRLANDQLEVLLEEGSWPALFTALAGVDRRISEDEWQKVRSDGGGLLRGSENWNQAMVFDATGDGLLSYKELQLYFLFRLDRLMERFDSDGDGELTAEEYAEANRYLQDDLFDLALHEQSLAVRPAQVIGLIDAAFVAALLFVFFRLRRYEGQVFALMLIFYPILRIIEEFIRADNPHDISRGLLTHNQITSLVLLAAGIIFFAALGRLTPSAGPLWAQRQAESDKRGVKKPIVR